MVYTCPQPLPTKMRYKNNKEKIVPMISAFICQSNEKPPPPMVVRTIFKYIFLNLKKLKINRTSKFCMKLKCWYKSSNQKKIPNCGNSIHFFFSFIWFFFLYFDAHIHMTSRTLLGVSVCEQSKKKLCT